MSADDQAPARYARLYRTLHGAPMLAGVPATIALTLLAIVCLGGFGLMMVSTAAGLAVVAGVVAAWGAIAFVHAQDRVAMATFALRRFYTFRPVVTSYTRSPFGLRIEEDAS